MRKALVIVLLVLIGSARIISVNAEELEKVEDNSKLIQPMFVDIQYMDASLDVSSNGRATVSAFLESRSGDEIIIITKLQQFKNNSWVTIKSWNISNADTYASVNKTYYVPKGYTYRTYNEGFVYSNGIEVDSTTITSNYYYY